MFTGIIEDIGIVSNLKTDVSKNKTKTGGVNYLAIAIPTKKLVFGFKIYSYICEVN